MSETQQSPMKKSELIELVQTLQTENAELKAHKTQEVLEVGPATEHVQFAEKQGIYKLMEAATKRAGFPTVNAWAKSVVRSKLGFK